MLNELNDSGYLTTHVLDTARGCPAEGIKIDLFKITAEYDLVRIATAETNNDGRLSKPILSGNDFRKGKYHGTISKWDDKGSLWEEAEYDRGILVAFTIKNGAPFDPTQVIDVSEDPDMLNMLFGD